MPFSRSLSSRRAWIEMKNTVLLLAYAVCRPPRGGRGLKSDLARCKITHTLSPSSRRAWIEITFDIMGEVQPRVSPSSRRAWIEIHRRERPPDVDGVALLAEGVD